ncbi:gfo/Idh/MocA family oxidoreductase, partial [Rhizobium sp. GCM10022189]
SATWRDIAVPAVPTNYQRFAEAVRTGKQDDPTFRHAANLQKVIDLAIVSEKERRELNLRASDNPEGSAQENRADDQGPALALVV